MPTMMSSNTSYTTSYKNLLLSLVVLLSAPKAAMSQIDSNSTDCLTISDIICTEGINLNALCEAITITELNDDLDVDAWTIFAPTDDAFEGLGRDNLDSLVFGNDTVALTDLLLFHIVPGVTLTSDILPCEAGNNLLEMANGVDSRTLCENKVTPIEQRGQFNDKEDAPKFIDMDIMACNGVIHTLDKVLLYESLPFDLPESSEMPIETAATVTPSVNATTPDTTNDFVTIPPSTETPTTESPTTETPTTTPTTDPPVDALILNGEEEPECLSIADLACSNSDFSILCTLLVEHGLAENLRSATWTVFAPTDEAFENAPPFPSDRSISWILMGHTVPGVTIPAEDLACSELTTMGNGKDTRTVCKREGVYQKGRGNSDEERPEIILADVEACNGVVHVVNQVILY